MNATRISAAGWIRPDGLPVMNNTDGFAQVSLLNEMFYPASISATGKAVDVRTHEGMDGSDCRGWTSNARADLDVNGLTTLAEGSYWCTGFEVLCDARLPITCFGVDLETAATPAKTSGRAAFVSRGGFAAGAGIGAADALCQAEAASAGLARADRFLAALALSTVSAASRFDANGAPWVRPTGLLLAKTAQDFLNGVLLAPVYTTADGSPRTNAIWVGARGLNSVANENCDDWSSASNAANVDIGESGVANASAFDYGPAPCSSGGASVLCMEP